MIFENLEYIFRSFKVNNVDKGCDLGKPDKDQGSLFREKQLGLVPHWVQRILLNQQCSHHLKVGPAPFQLFFVFFHNFLKLVMSGFFLNYPPPLPIFRVVVMCLMLKWLLQKNKYYVWNQIISLANRNQHPIISFANQNQWYKIIWTRQWFAGVINNQVFLRHSCL